MTDLSWLSSEAKTLHALFSSIFYSFALVLLLIGVVMEYFKLPIGGAPQFAPLAGRFLVAAILLTSYPDVSNAIADFTDSLANQIGSLNSIKLVLSKYYDKLCQFQMSWTSIKDSVLMLISFVTFFLLYISVYIADAAITYAWVLLYVFSPLLIALYVLPSTAGATKALYRSLLEVGAWKIVWSVLATLLWSSALSQINDPESNVNFITAVSFNLILAGSLLMTPFVVNALAGAGLSSLAAQTAGIAAGAALFSPGQILTSKLKKSTKKAGGSGEEGEERDPGGGSGSWSNFSEKYGSDPSGGPGRGSSNRSAFRASTQKRSSDPQRPGVGPIVRRVEGTPKPEPRRYVEAAPGNTARSAFRDTKTSVSFKSAVTSYQPPANRSEYQKKPVQRALFNESRKPNGTSEVRR